MTTTLQKISVLDLTAGQVENLERRLDLPINRWPEAPSLVDLYCAVLAEYTGEPEESFKALTMRELIARVSLDEESDPNE